MTGCPQAPSFATVVDYLAGDLAADEEDALEQHLFSCGDCSRAVEEVAALTGAIAEAIPPALTADRLRQLRASLRIRETRVETGQTAEAWFTQDVDLLVHALQTDLTGVERVDLEVYGPTGDLFMRVEAVPFDEPARTVYVACQRHLRGDEDVEDTRFRLVAVQAGEGRTLGDYLVRHHWGPRL